ncbi:type IV pilus twitching motility protein PilT [Fusobacterium sp.]|uniref:type IV pilus twitching motility protein PilT n=1 Tax=Fusobacterium sp. TaxID=68766 RepID=UPI002629E146|nr:PilT/PilU family type 4a pilus ATPase [Fusobacterium sp.]
MDRETFFSILNKAKTMKASDIHLLANELPVFRINGKLVRIEEYKKFTEEDMKNLSSFVTKEENIKTLEKERELDFSFNVENINCRINIFYEKENIGMSIRIVQEEPFTLEELEINKKIYDILEKRQGIIIISGKSGSGKSSTLAGIIEKFNREENLNILTIEDPIEYIFKNKKSIIRQREVKRDTKNFIDALKSALRQDLDVIMVGELRDNESLEMALTAAETGHLVLATLHTNGAVDTIDRIISAFPENKKNLIQRQLASNLIGIIYQELIDGNDNNRVPLCEMLHLNKGIENLIRNGKINQIQSFIDISGRDGMLNKEECLKELYKNNKISESQFENNMKILKRNKI